MSTTDQLNQLHELDLEIESAEQAFHQKTSQLGNRQVLDDAQSQLASVKQQMEELRRLQRDAEGEVDDVLSKITTADEQLYGGKITSPKELSGLQHEVDTMKKKSDQLENKALGIIDGLEAADKRMVAASSEFKKLEKEWQIQQRQLSDDIEQLKSSLSDLKQRRHLLSGEIDPQAVELYEIVRQQKKPPLARVERGICRVCRISLSSSELQRVRRGNPVKCGSCGRILFLS
ncbi:zinc ribbon domain-containing protein [Chloroflexota bacterium]